MAAAAVSAPRSEPRTPRRAAVPRPSSGPVGVPDREPYRSFVALVEAMEALAAAVVRHDARALEAATATAAELVAGIERLAADGLEFPDRASDGVILDHFASRLAASARLAAHLIERAWSSEATALHLLARCLGGGADGTIYGSAAAGAARPPGQTLVERRA